MPPVVALSEWADYHGVPRTTARHWIKLRMLPAAYRSPPVRNGTWLIPSNTPVPAGSPYAKKRRPA